MGARATNARWFRTPAEPAEPYSFFSPKIVERPALNLYMGREMFIEKVRRAGVIQGRACGDLFPGLELGPLLLPPPEWPGIPNG